MYFENCAKTLGLWQAYFIIIYFAAYVKCLSFYLSFFAVDYEATFYPPAQTCH